MKKNFLSIMLFCSCLLRLRISISETPTYCLKSSLVLITKKNMTIIIKQNLSAVNKRIKIKDFYQFV